MRLAASIVAPVLAAVALLYVPTPVATGAKPPPGIADVEGSYRFKVRTTWTTIDDGVVHSRKMTERWTIAATSATTATVSVPDAGLTFDGYYGHGVLVWGYHDSGYPFDHYGVLRFAGKSGKTKAKGQVAWVGLDGDELEVMSGRRDDDPPEPTTGKTHDGRASSHPAVRDLVGTYRVRVRGTIYAPTSGGIEKGGDRLTLTIRQGGDEDLLIRPEGEDTDLPARYREGVLTLSVLDDPAAATFGIWARLLVRGKPGKLHFTGPFLTFERLGQSDDEAELGRMAGRQIRD